MSTCPSSMWIQHSGVLLDGMGDVALIKQNREMLQGRPKKSFGGRSQTMRFAYPFTLCRRGVVVTMDLAADNLDMLKTDHWLSDRRNILHLVLDQQSWVGGTGVSQETQSRPMSLWTCTELLTFLTKQDVQGPASVLF